MSYRYHRSRVGLSLALPMIAAALALLLNGRALAQADADRADIARTQAALGADTSAPGEVEGHAVSSPNDSDLGEQAILKKSEGYQPFTISAALPAYYTSNVALVRSGERDDFLEAPLVAVVFQPRINNNLYAVASVREQLFYYDQYDMLNFGAFDAQAGLIYMVPAWHNLIVRGQFIYERLTAKDSFDAFFENYSIFLNLELPFHIGRAQQIFLGVDANISIEADPEPPRRHDYETYLGYSLKVTRDLSSIWWAFGRAPISVNRSCRCQRDPGDERDF